MISLTITPWPLTTIPLSARRPTQVNIPNNFFIKGFSISDGGLNFGARAGYSPVQQIPCQEQSIQLPMLIDFKNQSYLL